MPDLEYEMSGTAAHPIDVIDRQLDLSTNAALHEIARTLGVPHHGAQRLRLINALSQRIGSPAHFDLLSRRLSSAHWSVLNLLPLRMGPVPLRSLVVVLRDQGLRDRAALD